MLGIDRFDRAAHGLRHHDHARAAAERIVVALQVLVLGIVAQIYDLDREFPLFHRSADDTAEQRRKHFGKQR